MLQLDQVLQHTSSPVLTSSSSNTTSLAATLTPGTPTALDELKHNNGILLSLNSLNLTSLQSSSSGLLHGPPSSTASESNSDSSLLSSLGMGGPDDEDYEYDDDLDDEEDDYNSEDRTRRAKEAAKILLAQCLLEDNPRYYSDSFANRSSRLGLAPITLLLNPETPCPTKIIPLPDSSSSAYSLDDCSSSEEEQEANDVQAAQAASLFIRLL